jgi:hypothetical protein
MNKRYILNIFIICLISFTLIYAEGEKEKKLVITGVMPESGAEVAGIKSGDILMTYNNKIVNSIEKLNKLKANVKDDSIEITVKRGEERIQFIIPKGFIGIYLKEILPDIEFDKDAVIIEHIDRLDWDTGEMSSFIGALTRIAEYLNIQKDYVYLMGVSGSAFRILFYEGWCPSSPDATVGFDCGKVALESIKLKSTYLLLDKEKKNKAEIRQKIMESIDNRMPVIAIDLIEIPEWGLIVGYQKDGEELIVCDYFDRRKGYDIAEKFPWIVVIVSGEKNKIDDYENFKNALKIAQELYETEKYEAYYSGLAAIKYWIKHLEEDDFKSFDGKQFENAMLANAWIFERLADDRGYGAHYVRSFVGHFPQKMN